MIFIISSFCSLSKAQNISGNLNISVQNIDAGFIEGVQVFRYDSAKQYIDYKTTGSNGIANWTGIAVGRYYLEAYHNGNVLPDLGEEFWGINYGLVTFGGTTNVTIKRNEPYTQNIVFKNNATNEILSSSNPIPPNKTVRVEVTVKNQSTFARTVIVEVLIDHDKVSPYDFDITMGPQNIGANTGDFTFARTFTPTAEGLYFRGSKTESYIDTEYKLTDTWAWGLIDGAFKVNQNAVNNVQENSGQIPKHFVLLQNYPNPFNPSTTIKYSVPIQFHITLLVFDILGRKVVTLVDEEKLPGTYEAKFDGSFLSSGVYFYQLRSFNYNETKKLFLIK
jgi:hypothetical protein